jgi:hypothetical protein
MNQPPLFLEDKCKYIVKHNGNINTAWHSFGVFTFNNYRQEKNCDVLERIGTPKEVFK